MTWKPKPEEAFVFRNEITGEAIVILRPGGEQPHDVHLGGWDLGYDEEKTSEVRMFMRVSERKQQADPE